MKVTDKARNAVQNLLNLFESGSLPEAIAQTVIHRKQSDAPSATWSTGNILLMLLAGTQDARGYRQWEQVGRKVRKGAKAFYILAPLTRTIKETDEETGEETEKRIVYGFKGVPVFRVEDTEGEPIETPDYTPEKLPPLLDVARAYGVQVEYGPMIRSAYGFYQPGQKRIYLGTEDPNTFFHELAHAIHDTIRPLKGGQDAEQEIVAETVAATLCHMYGFEGYLPHAKQYIAHYGGQNVSQAIAQVLAEVEQVLSLILQTAEKVKQAS